MENITVKSCSKLKELPAKDGKPAYQIYQVELSDGRKGESFAKEIPVGTPVAELAIEESQYGLKIKWNQPKSGGFGKSGGYKPDPYKDAQIIAQSSLSKAVDLIVAGKLDIKDLKPSAKKFFDYVYELAEPFKGK